MCDALGPALHGRPKIHTLKLSAAHLTMQGFAHLGKHLVNNSSITHLYLNDNDFTIPDTRDQSCRYNGLEVKEMIYEVQCLFSYNQYLEHIHLNSCKISDELLKTIGIGLFLNKTLVSMSIARNKISDTAIPPFISGLEKCNTMKTIDLSHNGLRDYSASLFAGLLRFNTNKLVSLDLSNNMLTKVGVSQLQLTIDDIPRIKTLNLDMNLNISHA